MFSLVGRWTMMAAATASAFTFVPIAAPVHAQNWGTPSCRGLEGRERARCERAREKNESRWDDRNRHQRDRERERRKDAKADGVVAGVIGTVLIGGIIAAATSGGKKKKEDRNRRDYCSDRYGSYDERSDSYRASDARWYRCE